MLDGLITFFTNYGYFAVFGVLLLCGMGLPIPEDFTLVAGGVISSVACSADSSFIQSLKDCHQVHIMFAVSMAGVLLGDSLMFFLGRTFGQRLLEVRFFKKILTPERYHFIQNKFERFGFWFVFAARFMPGLRSPIFVVAGITRKVSFFKFFLTDGLAAIVSVPLWVYLGFWGERQLSDLGALEHYVKRGQLAVIIAICLFVLAPILIWLVKRKRALKKTT